MSGVLQLFGVMMAIFVPICMLVMVTGYFDNKKNTNRQLDKLRRQLAEHSPEDMQVEIDSLKERIVVLESIVTDRRYDLDRKISNL